MFLLSFALFCSISCFSQLFSSANQCENRFHTTSLRRCTSFKSNQTKGERSAYAAEHYKTISIAIESRYSFRMTIAPNPITLLHGNRCQCVVGIFLGDIWHNVYKIASYDRQCMKNAHSKAAQGWK